jgi:hypothetical protein
MLLDNEVFYLQTDRFADAAQVVSGSGDAVDLESYQSVHHLNTTRTC